MVVTALIAREGEWEEEEGGGNRFALTMMGIRESEYFTCTVYGGLELDPVCDTAVLLYCSTTVLNWPHFYTHTFIFI
jgi:hypothetical protein